MNLLDIARAALVERSAITLPAAVASAGQAAELRALLTIIAADWPEAERAEALAVALADPDAGPDIVPAAGGRTHASRYAHFQQQKN